MDLQNNAIGFLAYSFAYLECPFRRVRIAKLVHSMECCYST